MLNTQTTTAAESESGSYKPKRRAGQATTRAARTKIATPKKRPVKLVLGESQYEKLVLHSLKRGLNLSQCVELAIDATLNDWTIHAKPGTKAE